MDKEFDDLFNDFLKRRGILFDTDDISKMKNSEVQKLIEIIKKIENNTINSEVNEALEKEFDETLKEPDEVENYIEDGLFYEKKIWHTPQGDFVKVIVSERPIILKKDSPVQSKEALEKKLEIAIENENYEEAAKLRDLLKAPVKKIRRGKAIKKTEKKNKK